MMRTDIGIEGYTVRKTLELDKPHTLSWKPTKRPNFLDDIVRAKAKNCVPASFYNIAGTLV
jgi:hypothetical protein